MQINKLKQSYIISKYIVHEFIPLDALYMNSSYDDKSLSSFLSVNHHTMKATQRAKVKI